jgi:hypothetical protein
VAGISSVVAHPGSEYVVMAQQRRLVAAASQSCGLRVRADVEQADRDDG